jgi:dihydroflavonol-4-reductase
LKTLVTGATGFIGSHLVRALVEKGRDVRCLVRKTSNTRLLKELRVELVCGDLLNKDSLIEALRDIDIVHHLAAEVYSKRTSDFFRINVLGMNNLLEACAHEPIKKFIYLSSIAVNGVPSGQGILINEESPCSPFTPYGRSKLEAEKLILCHFHKHGIPTAIIRAPVVYGPGQPYILTRIFNKIAKGRPIYIIDNGNNLRSLCYIDNLIQGILLAEDNAGLSDSVYVISDKKAYTFNEIFQTIAEAEKVKMRKVCLPSFIADIAECVFNIMCKLFNIYSIELYGILIANAELRCDISKAVKELGYKPQINIKEGVKKTFNWYQTNFISKNE